MATFIALAPPAIDIYPMVIAPVGVPAITHETMRPP